MLSQFCRFRLCSPMDYSLPGSSVHGVLLARILEWVATLSSRGSSQPRDQPTSLMSPTLAVGSLPLAPPGAQNRKELRLNHLEGTKLHKRINLLKSTFTYWRSGRSLEWDQPFCSLISTLERYIFYCVLLWTFPELVPAFSGCVFISRQIWPLWSAALSSQDPMGLCYSLKLSC